MIIAAIVAVVIIAAYLSALNIALPPLNRLALQRRLDVRGKPDAGDWLHDEIDSVVLATALLRTIARMSIYVLVLALTVELNGEAVVGWWDLIVSGFIAAGVIWLTTVVTAGAVARHAGVRLVAANLPVLKVIHLLCRPIVKIGMLLDRLVARLSGPEDLDEGEVELLQSIEDVQREGTFDMQSAEILENVVEFSAKQVSQIMTVRPQIEGIELTNDLARIREFIGQAMHSRIPVYRGTIDNIVGILYIKDLVRYLGEEPENFQLAPILRQPIVVPETKPVRELLSVFQRSEVHLALVVDEFGATAGLVTIEDVLEEIVGEIRDEHEPEELEGPSFIAIDDTNAEVDGRFRVDELNERLHLSLPENGEYETIAGFMLAHFGRVPSPGETFQWHTVRFTALASTPTHLTRVGIQLQQATNGTASNGEATASAAEYGSPQRERA